MKFRTGELWFLSGIEKSKRGRGGSKSEAKESRKDNDDA